MVRKKIAIITPLLSKGGMERVAANLSRLLYDDYDVYLVVFDAKKIDYPYKGKIIDMEININNRNVFKRTMNLYKITNKLRNIKKREKFDYIISMGEIANIPNILSGGNNNILTIHENRFNAFNDLQRKLVNLAIKFLYKRNNVKKIVTVSKDIENDLIQFYKFNKKKLTTIYNPFDIEEINKKSKEPLNHFSQLFNKNKVIVNVGRLTFPKGQWFLLRIFKELKNLYKNDNIKLVILGDGELRNELIKLSEILGLKTFNIWGSKKFSENYDVYFLGFKNNPYKFIKNSHLFISTSLWEGLPNVIIEAMASEQAVVYSNCKSGPLEILAPRKKVKYNYDKIIFGEYGILLPKFPKKLLRTEELLPIELYWVEKLTELLNDEETITNYKNKALIRARDFSFEHIKKRWKQILD
ncbi:glycosyltransferase [Persephonella sp. IF05-L8]|uniref:glycosyltransferase n=1 Tax=Persephonella sp. IF05-L8 TaxID=1158338 RepID=UPI000494DF8C